VKIPERRDYNDFEKVLKEIPEFYSHECEFYWHVLNISLLTNEQKIKMLKALDEESNKRVRGGGKK
jgi:hypothetical protein